MFDVILRSVRDELEKAAAETSSPTQPDRSSLPVINFRKLEEHANEHRMMELLGIGPRGRPMIGSRP